MPTVIVVGAGYAGLHAARTARRDDVEVVLVDAEATHEPVTRLAAVAAGRRDAGDAFAPLEGLVDAEVVRGRVVRVERDDAAVVLEDGSRVEGDAVVVTVGGSAALPPVPGIGAGARVLHSAADALRLRDDLASTDALVVVGGGPTGVQLAAETAAARPGTRVTLVEREGALLGRFRRPLGRRAQHVLERRGVDVRTGTTVDRVDGDRLHLSDGTQLEGLTVWATGVEADGGALLPWAGTRDGRVLVDRRLRVGGRVLAAGDVVQHHDVVGRPLAPSAQVALQAGRAAGANAARLATGERLRPAVLLELGYVVDLGGGTGVAELGPVPLAAPGVDRLVPLLHEGIDVRHLLQAAGPRGVLRHATGRHDPDEATLRRAERPDLRSVG